MPTPSDSPALTARKLLLRGGSGVFGLRIAALLLAFGVDMILTWTLGLEQYGIFAICVSLQSLLLTLGSLGVGSAMVKVLPAESARNQPELVRGMLRWSSRYMFLSGVILALVLALTVTLLEGTINSTIAEVLLILALFLPLQVLAVQRQSALIGFKHPVLAMLPEQVVRWLAFLLILGGSLLLGHTPDVAHVTWFYGGGVLVGFLIASYWQARFTPAIIKSSSPRMHSRAWWILAAPLCWNMLMKMLNTRADPLMLGWLHNAEGAALYAIANRLASLLLFGLTAVGAVIAPLIAEQHASGRKHETQAMLTLAAKGTALYALPLAAILIIGGQQILALFRPEFRAAYPVLCLLVVGRTLTCVVGSVGFLLTMTGNERRVAKTMTACAVLKIALNLLLIPAYGEIGAAWATLASLLVGSASLYAIVRTRIGVDPSMLTIFRGKAA
ncbi:MAG: O-antigen/teichoic acid export membrane protein [Planctomycetota bacterium]